MRDNIEGQSAEPVANGSVSGSSNFAGPVSAATGTNQPAATASATNPTNTPVINTSGSTNSQQGSIDFAAMHKSKEEQTDEELLNNALTKKDKAEAKKIIAKRKKEADKAQKAKRISWFKKYGLLVGIVVVVLIAATVFGIYFLNKKTEEEVADDELAKIVTDPDYDYRENKAYVNEQKIKSALKEHAFDGIDVVNDGIDGDKVRSNLDAVVYAQTDEYVQEYYMLYEIIILLEESLYDETDELMAVLNPDNLDEKQLMPYYYAMYLYTEDVVGDSEAAEEYLTKYSNYF